MSQSELVSISTRDLSQLPSAEELERICQSLAMLDAILSPEWECRYFSFNSKWNPDLHERLASWRNGSGDEYFLLFSSAGATLKGFDHESPMSTWASSERKVWPGVLEGVPAEFAGFLAEPAFSLKDTTFCIWRTRTDSQWKHGPVSFPAGVDPDGSAAMLFELDGDPSKYVGYAKEYFEVDVPITAVQKVFAHEPLRLELIASLNSELRFEDILADASKIAYPVQFVG